MSVTGSMRRCERDLIQGSAELQRRHGDALKALIGRRLSAVWVVWDVGDDAWFTDAAVVLDLEGTRLEPDCYGVASISVTWGTLDLSKRPDWYGADDLVLEWRSNALPWLRDQHLPQPLV